MKKTAYGLASVALVCCLMTVGAASTTEDVKLTASDAAADDWFGSAVAVSGDTIVVGAYFNDDTASDSGSAYVFKPSGTGGYDQTKLVASDASANAHFGRSVAISGDTIVVGAYQHLNTGNGAVYVFEPDGEGGYDETKLTASDGALNDWFGWSVAISGDTIVVGAYQDDLPGAVASGSVYVFTPDGSGGYDETQLVASDAAAGDIFGYAVSISGDTIVVGAPHDADGGDYSGSAYVYTPDGDGGYDETKLTASDAAEGDDFGYSVAVSGDRVLVGAFANDDAGTSSGSAYVFTPDGTGGYDETKLTASVSSYVYGRHLAMAGDTIVIGEFGSVFVYTPDGAGGYDEEILGASDGVGSDWFGHAVAVSGDTIVVGAVYDDDAGNSSGSAYVFTLNSVPTADAGPDQSIQAGDLVTLDGSGSFDDNTASTNLSYAWTLTKPAGSTAVLSSATAVSPTFTADMSGIYSASLVVTDSTGHVSAPDVVTISSPNLAPTADAGVDLVGAVDLAITITGSAVDPESDTLTYAWTIITAPIGSTATLSNGTTLTPSLTPDEIGEYVLSLVASDPYDDSAADTMTLTVISGSDYAEEKMLDVSELIEELVDADYDSTGHASSLSEHVGNIVKELLKGKDPQAIEKLQILISRTDGCALRGAVDASGPGRDWIVTCDAQADVYPPLRAALDALLAQ